MAPLEISTQYDGRRRTIGARAVRHRWPILFVVPSFPPPHPISFTPQTSSTKLVYNFLSLVPPRLFILVCSNVFVDSLVSFTEHVGRQPEGDISHHKDIMPKRERGALRLRSTISQLVEITDFLLYLTTNQSGSAHTNTKLSQILCSLPNLVQDQLIAWTGYYCCSRDWSFESWPGGAVARCWLSLMATVPVCSTTAPESQRSPRHHSARVDRDRVLNL